jgi:hypothetical protein|tara:strand:- start:7964 stop:8155 length:192 start_codon:yes stop_codon:yes gene_type:complete
MRAGAHKALAQLIQAPVTAQLIDKGIPTVGLMAQMLVGQVRQPSGLVPPRTHLQPGGPGDPAF